MTLRSWTRVGYCRDLNPTDLSPIRTGWQLSQPETRPVYRPMGRVPGRTEFGSARLPILPWKRKAYAHHCFGLSNCYQQSTRQCSSLRQRKQRWYQYRSPQTRSPIRPQLILQQIPPPKMRKLDNRKLEKWRTLRVVDWETEMRVLLIRSEVHIPVASNHNHIFI